MAHEAVGGTVAVKDRRTILFVDHTANLGGGEIALLDLVRHLDLSHWEPIVLLGAEGPLRDRLLQAGVETHVLPLARRIADARKDSLGGQSLLSIGSALSALAYIWRLAGFIRRRRVDLVHTNSLKADVIGGFAARLAGRPVIWHVHDRIANDYLPKTVVSWFRWLCRSLPSAVIANSAATLDTLHLPRGKRRAVIPPGIDVEAFAPIQASAGAERIRRIGLIGRIAPWKGQHIFLEAATRIHRAFPDVRFQIVGAPLFGEDDYLQILHDRVCSLALDDYVEFTGFRDDVPRILADLEILVHASVTAEPFGQVVIQAMAAGKPVVATAGGGILDIVVDDVTGSLVPMNDAEALAAAVCALLADPEKGRRFGAAGLMRVREYFTIECTVALAQDFYRAVLANRPRR